MPITYSPMQRDLIYFAYTNIQLSAEAREPLHSVNQTPWRVFQGREAVLEYSPWPKGAARVWPPATPDRIA